MPILVRGDDAEVQQGPMLVTASTKVDGLNT